MNMRCALACLAVLWACGSDEPSSSTASKSSESNKPAESKPVAKTTPEPAPAPAEVYKAPASAPKPAAEATKPPETDPDEGLLADAETAPKTPAMPPEDEAPGIVHTPPPGDVPPDMPADAPPDMTDPAVADEPPAAAKAVAIVTPASGSTVTGTITFTRQATGVEVHVLLEGLTPGMHGLHVHETGDCSASDALTAGEHFNPTHAAHSSRDATERHVGDLGNVEADAAGRVDVTFTDRLLALSGESSILGRSLIVHADPDDFTSQPAGNSGARIGCGVIEEDKAAASKLPGG
jgi:superoxide dismutase, Cu-Zn family